MRSLRFAANPGATAPILLVWLPGAYHRPEDFLDAGFDARVRERGLGLDLEFVALDLEHVGDRRPVDELEREVVAPARARGCRTVWIGGISLGGFFALHYAIAYPEAWDGLCLLAPYVGNRMLAAEIAAAGGLAAWQPGPLAESDEERRIWRFIQSQRAQSAKRRPVYLGYGHDDRFAGTHRLMAGMLPADAVCEVPGGHDWKTWSVLWEHFLSSKLR